MKKMMCTGRARGFVLLIGAFVLLQSVGCRTAAPVPPPAYTPVVRIPSADQPPRVPPVEEIRRVEGLTGQLVTFGKLRTVIMSKEEIRDENGKVQEENEIRPMIERELAQRDFRIFSGLVKPESDVARVTRDQKAHLVVDLDARSEFLNTTGRFIRYRAEASARVVRGRDGTLLATSRHEVTGERAQDSRRAGRLALRAAGEEVTRVLVDDLLAKTDQLQWAGIIVQPVADMETAVRIRQELMNSGAVSFAELLEWNEQERKAVYEVIYGLRSESDLAVALSRIQRLRITPSRYEPGRMDALRQRMSHYK